MRVCEERNGIKLGDWRTAETTEKIGGNSWSLMKEDDVFAEAAMNPAGLALIQFLLGRSAMLAGLTSIVKAQTKDYFHLHSDAARHCPRHGASGAFVQCVVADH